MQTFMSRGVVSGIFLIGLTLHAAPILIDSFNTTIQFASVGFGGPNPVSASSGAVTAGGEAIGGARNVTVTRITGDGNDSINVSSAAPGTFNLNLAADDTGTGIIIWDGDTDTSINHGLSVDLTGGGVNTHIRLSMRSDLVAPIVITVYSGAGNFSTGTLAAPGLGFGATPYTLAEIPFASFVVGGGTGANFSNVSAITFLVDGSSVAGLDFQMDFIRADVAIPEPTTFALLGIGFLGIGLAGARRRL